MKWNRASPTAPRLAEAVALGEKLGLDRERLLETLPEMPVVSAAHRGKLVQAANKDYHSQFRFS